MLVKPGMLHSTGLVSTLVLHAIQFAKLAQSGPASRGIR